MSELTYEETIRRIENQKAAHILTPKEHTKMCLAALGHPEDRFRTVHVAGTNGKGSVCSYIGTVFRKAGIRTGLFTSPHLIRINERISIDGNDISDEEFARLYRVVREKLEDVFLAYGEPIYFETLFLMACAYFAENGVEAAVIETGIGGRLDATSSIGHPDISVITQVGLDHMNLLGETIPEIAGEKAGIIKPGVPVVFDAQNPEAEAVIRRKAAENGSAACALHRSDYQMLSSGNGTIDFCTSFRYDGHAVFALRSYAAYQVSNASLAVLALKTLKERDPVFYGRMTADAVCEGLLAMRWPARMEEVVPRVFIDGAHNPDGIRRFAEAAEAVRKGGEASLIFSAVSDKDYSEMIRILAEAVPWKRIYVTGIENERGTRISELLACFMKAGRGDAEGAETFSDAYRKARNNAGDGYIFICGSLYLAGAAKETVLKESGVIPSPGGDHL